MDLWKMFDGVSWGSVAEWAMVVATVVSVGIAFKLIRPSLESARAAQAQLAVAKTREESERKRERLERAGRLVVWWAHDHSKADKSMVLVINNGTEGVVEDLWIEWSSDSAGSGEHKLKIFPPGYWRVDYKTKGTFDFPEPCLPTADLRPHLGSRWRIKVWSWSDGDPDTYLERQPSKPVKVLAFDSSNGEGGR